MAAGSSLSYFGRRGQAIVGLATASGGSLAVIRISGSDLSFLKKLVDGDWPEPGAFAYRKLLDHQGSVVDSALILHFKSPKSFTGENVVELQVHGVPALIQKIIQECCRLGCLSALPGEFSFRAFANNKISLAEAEALNVALSTEGLSAPAASELLGFADRDTKTLSLGLTKALSAIFAARGRVEAAIDFSEAAEEQQADVVAAIDLVQAARSELSALLTSYRNFSDEATEPVVSIVGSPNAGKSTLLNLLVGGDRALVSEHAGTTRDVVEARLRLPSGRWIRLRDTAGLREFSVEDLANTPHLKIEEMGIVKSIESARHSSAVIFVVDPGIGGEPPRGTNLNTVVRIESRSDLYGPAPHRFDLRAQVARCRQFVLERLDALLTRSSLEQVQKLALSKRQGLLIEKALVDLDYALQALGGMRPIELCGQDLTEAERALKMVSGQDLGQEYISEIFRQFCLGK